MRVYLGLGANIGEPRETVIAAMRHLGGSLRTPCCSSLYRSAPMGVIDQPEFINAVVSGHYVETPHNLLCECQEIEKRYGRNRPAERRHGPRPLDIDILLFGDRRISESKLCIPHPRMTERRFVLVPLLEIHPDLCEPGSGMRYFSYLNALPEAGIYYDSTPRVYF